MLRICDPASQPARYGALLGMVRRPDATANMARFIFLSPWAGDFFADWQGIADNATAIRPRGLRQDAAPPFACDLLAAWTAWFWNSISDYERLADAL